MTNNTPDYEDNLYFGENKMLKEYTYEEQESGRSDTLVKAIERIEKLEKQLELAKQSISSALNYLACMNRISETEPNEQLAFNELRKCLEELENA